MTETLNLVQHNVPNNKIIFSIVEEFVCQISIKISIHIIFIFKSWIQRYSKLVIIEMQL